MSLTHALLGVVLLCLAACGAPKAINIDPAAVRGQAQAALAAADAAVAAYTATTPVSADVVAKIATADAAARTVIADIPTALPTDLPGHVANVLKALNDIVAALPPGALPPQARAEIIAFEVLASAMPALLQAKQAAASP